MNLTIVQTLTRSFTRAQHTVLAVFVHHLNMYMLCGSKKRIANYRKFYNTNTCVAIYRHQNLSYILFSAFSFSLSSFYLSFSLILPSIHIFRLYYTFSCIYAKIHKKKRRKKINNKKRQCVCETGRLIRSQSNEFTFKQIFSNSNQQQLSAS